jgi:hypothetical protein
MMQPRSHTATQREREILIMTLATPSSIHVAKRFASDWHDAIRRDVDLLEGHASEEGFRFG